MSKKRDFTVPCSAVDGDGTGGFDTLSEILAGLDSGGTEPDGNGDNRDSAEDQHNTDQDQEKDLHEQTPDEHEQDQHEQSHRPTAQDRANYAFKQMRQQNQALLGALQGIAKSRNIQYTDTADLLAKLNNASMEQQAKDQNVPVALLQEIQSLRRQTEQFTAQQNQTRLTNQFSQLMSDYKLSRNDLESFVDELATQGADPMKVDLVKEYKTMHQDEIISALVDARVEELLKRSKQADSNASTPGAATGGSSGNQDGESRITTVAALDAALKDVKI